MLILEAIQASFNGPVCVSSQWMLKVESLCDSSVIFLLSYFQYPFNFTKLINRPSPWRPPVYKMDTVFGESKLA